jgi:hypothetical protein
MHYGKTLPYLIGKAMNYEEGEEKGQLISMIANHMKKCFTNFNKEGIDDRKICDDIRELSNGEIDLNEGSLQLKDVKETAHTPNKNNRQKKR